MNNPAPASLSAEVIAKGKALEELEALVAPYIVGKKHVQVRVAALRHVVAAAREREGMREALERLIGALKDHRVDFGFLNGTASLYELLNTDRGGQARTTAEGALSEGAST